MGQAAEAIHVRHGQEDPLVAGEAVLLGHCLGPQAVLGLDAHVVHVGLVAQQEAEVGLFVHAPVLDDGLRDDQRGRCDVQTDGGLLRIGHLPELVRDGVQAVHQRLQLRLKKFAVLRQDDVAPVGGEQLYTQLRLQPLDGLGQRGLGDVQALGAAGDVLGAGDLQEITQLQQFHASPPYIGLKL